ncbi:MAG: aldo/keto reductase, partial [Bacteroidales bacterium]|nr:aldo/keto reductase [Bacteroidales bacterium]
PKTEGGHGSHLDPDATNKMVDYAFAHGINYFDTAPAYGESEKVMGVALSRHPRNSYLLATKMSNFPSLLRGMTGVEGAKAMFERSLANLQVDYIDFLLCHSINNLKDFKDRFIENDVLEYLKSLKESGKIKYLGFSYHGNNADLEPVLDYYDWDFVQIQLNYLDFKEMLNDDAEHDNSNGTTDSETLYKILESRGIPVVIMEPVKGGLLASVNENLKEMMAKRHPELSPAGVALTFASTFPGVMATLSGMSNMEQLKENIATFTDFKPFNEEDNAFLQTVADLYNANPNIPCTGCEYCMPCPNGVYIPKNFSVYNTTSSQLNLPDPTNPDKDYNKKKKIFLKRYKSELKPSQMADACTKCNVCLEKCPQHIPIPKKLQQIKDLIDALG